MATTPTYSWPIPDDTDLVKDGAEAIRDLGNAIDTTVGGLGSGLVHIETLAFSASSSESFNNVFSADYDNYRILVTPKTASGITTLRFRLRVAGVDNSSANSYNTQRLVIFSTTASPSRAAANSGSFGTFANEQTNGFSIDIFKPFIAERTVTNAFTTFDNAGNTEIDFQFTTHNQSVSYDGITIFPGASNMTGSISIYGYAKA